jgi:hypothetical protein
MDNPLFWVSLLGWLGLLAFFIVFVAQSGVPLWLVGLLAVPAFLTAVFYGKWLRSLRK